LRVSDDYDDDHDILFLIEAASEVVIDYLKLAVVPTEWVTEDDDPAGTPKLVQAVVLKITAEMFKNREASVGDVLTDKIVKLLVRMRDPAMA
jgi:hypothetical protein